MGDRKRREQFNTGCGSYGQSEKKGVIDGADDMGGG